MTSTWTPPVILDGLGHTQLRICRYLVEREADDQARVDLTASEIAWHLSGGDVGPDYVSTNAAYCALRALEGRRIMERSGERRTGLARRAVTWRITDAGLQAFADKAARDTPLDSHD